MKQWKRVSLITTLVLLLVAFGLFKLLNWRIVPTSAPNIEFKPSKDIQQVELDSISEKPKNIIVFIADGFGFAHMSLAMLTDQSSDSLSVWQKFDVKGWHDPRSTYGPLTDSGASATAMATGTAAFWEMLGMDPEGNTVQNLFELASENGYNTGIVTDAYVWDATPGAFVVHTESRENSRAILQQMASSELDLLFGELEDVGEDENPELDETLEILSTRFQLLDKNLSLPAKTNPLQPVAAIYEEDEVQDLSSIPNLVQLTRLGLDYLETDDPFILLVECEEMDAAAHANRSKRTLRGLKALEAALSFVMDFAQKNGETLVLFTSDHETGGLAATVDFSKYPNMQLVWASKEHTATVVPLLAFGPGAEYFEKVDRNWEIGLVLKRLVENR